MAQGTADAANPTLYLKYGDRFDVADLPRTAGLL